MTQLKQKLARREKLELRRLNKASPISTIFDEVMGHHDSNDLLKMAIEGSSIFTSELKVNDTSPNESVKVSLDESEPPDDVTEVQKG